MKLLLPLMLTVLYVVAGCAIYPHRKFAPVEVHVKEKKKAIKVTIKGHAQSYSHHAFLKRDDRINCDTVHKILYLDPRFTPLSGRRTLADSYYLVYYRTIRLRVKKNEFPNGISVIDYTGWQVEVSDSLKEGRD